VEERRKKRKEKGQSSMRSQSTLADIVQGFSLLGLEERLIKGSKFGLNIKKISFLIILLLEFRGLE